MNLKMLLFASVSLVLFASCHNSDEPYMTLATKTLDVEAEGCLLYTSYFMLNDGLNQSKDIDFKQ